MSSIQNKYNYIYKTTNILTHRFYIGMHSTNNINDGYIGSGKILLRSIEKYGIDNHHCKILEYISDRNLLSIREAEIVNADLIADEMCMNIALGGCGGWDHVNSSLTKEQKTKRSKAGWLAAGGVEFNRKNQRDFQQRLKEEPEYRAWWLSTLKPPPSWVGKRHTAETIKKMQRVHKGKHEGKKNSQYGTVWVYSFVENKPLKIKNTQLQEYLDSGCVKGRKPKL